MARILLASRTVSCYGITKPENQDWSGGNVRARRAEWQPFSLKIEMTEDVHPATLLGLSARKFTMVDPDKDLWHQDGLCEAGEGERAVEEPFIEDAVNQSGF
jgi:hypothetical protein